jgi:hypothetical protein
MHSAEKPRSKYETKELNMLTHLKKAVHYGGAIGIVICQLTTPAFADLNYNPNWPSVQCKDGKRFPYNPNGAPTYAGAAEKCKTHGGVDSGRGAITAKPDKATAVKGPKGKIPEVTPGCGGMTGNGC